MDSGLGVALAAGAAVTLAQSGGEFELPWSTFGNSTGGTISGGDYALENSVGGVPVGVIAGGDYSLSSGYLPGTGSETSQAVEPAPTATPTPTPVVECPTFTGRKRPSRDLAGDGPCSDSNGNGRLDFADVVALHNGLSDRNLKIGLVRLDQDNNGVLDCEDVRALFQRVIARKAR